MKNMKKNILRTGLFAIGAMMLSSCGEDYLQTDPEAYVSSDAVSNNIEYCKLVINGIMKTMSAQYYSVQGENGEGTTKTWHNNYCCGFSQKCGLTGWASVINCTNRTITNGAYATYRWSYYYKLILNANNAIESIDAFDPDNNTDYEARKEFYLAQAYTMRAYAYMQLTQLFCKRWQDSNNGQSRGVVLRLDTSRDAMPCSTLAGVFEQIYKDLDTAIEKFQASGLDRDDVWEVNEDVAHAIYSRAAIYREDWATSAEQAELARANYTLMGESEYFNGFSTANNEWIWSLYSASDETLYYYGYYAYNASNSSASICRSYPFSIDKILYNSIPDTDVRKGLYLAPTDEEYAESGISKTTGRATKGTFFTRVWNDYGDYLYNSGTSVSYVYIYMQVKVRCTESPGVGQLNLARAAEMYYNEAESLCKLGRDSEARELLIEAVKPYDSEYTCTLTGDELYEEIKKYRIFDLFLEGYTYFDEKRWNQDRVRVSLANGGNWHATFAGTTTPSDMNGWTWVIPIKETDYNEYINNNIEPDNWSIDDSTTW